jgi:DNA processing protein
MALGVVVVEDAQYSVSLITAWLAMEFEAFGVPGAVTQPSSFGPNQMMKRSAKLVTGWEDVVEALSTPVRAKRLPVEARSHRARAALVKGASFGPLLYGLQSVEEAGRVDELVELSGLISPEVLAALFDMELKSVIRQLPGRQFLRVL